MSHSDHERFWSKVQYTSTCWPWLSRIRRDGYGSFWLHGRVAVAHRTSFELLAGVIPCGLVLDHLCRNRRCVNPAHLEPVTIQENIRRGFRGTDKARLNTCKRGHDMSDGNIRHRTYNGRSWRICRACERIHSATYYQRKTVNA